MKPNVVGFIFARGGSKGIPRKNICLLNGKPLIAYAIETAKASTLIDRVIVSTDDEEIADIARQFGAEVPFMRPKELAQDRSPEWLAWQHTVRCYQEKSGNFDVFIALPTTSPLRNEDDIDICIETLIQAEVDMVITVKSASRSPYYNMICLDELSLARLAIQPKEIIHQRQSVPMVYDMTTVAYVMYPDYLLKSSSIFEGRVKAVLVPDERAIDIDTSLDLLFADLLLQNPEYISSKKSKVLAK